MNLIFAIQFAGALHFLAVGANFVLPFVVNYRENLAKVSPIIRDIFLVHAFFIVVLLVGFGSICLLFPASLCGPDPLGRFLSAFFAVFWTLRVAIQLFYYDHAIKAQYPIGHLFFTGIFSYFAIVFTTAALHTL